MFAIFVEFVDFFEKSLIQKFLFLCKNRVVLHKINSKLHRNEAQRSVAEGCFNGVKFCRNKANFCAFV